MKYCSIEEAWGEKFDNNEKFTINKPTYNENPSLKFLNTTTEDFNNSKSIKKAYNIYEGFTATGEYKENFNNKFDKFLEKFDTLIKYKSFRDKIIERMDNLLGKHDKNIIEKFSLSGCSDDDYSDVILMILFGIFIIFVLDSFVRLGRYKN